MFIFSRITRPFSPATPYGYPHNYLYSTNLRTHRCAICRSRSIFIQNSGQAAYAAAFCRSKMPKRRFPPDPRGGFGHPLRLLAGRPAALLPPRRVHRPPPCAAPDRHWRGSYPRRVRHTSAAQRPRSTLLRALPACPAALHLPRRVHRAASFAPPVIDFAAGLARRVR